MRTVQNKTLYADKVAVHCRDDNFQKTFKGFDFVLVLNYGKQIGHSNYAQNIIIGD